VSFLSQTIGKFLEVIGLKVSMRKAQGEELWADNAEFLKLLAEVKGRTLVTPDRLFFVYQFARQAKRLPGDVAQVGVYKGGTARLIARVFSGTQKTVHLFDTFAGMPSPDPQKDNLDYVRKSIFSDTSVEDVRRYLGDCANVSLHEGVFPETAGPVRDKSFCFVYLDADLYKSTRDAAEFFYPRMAPGGIMVFDDYGSKKCPGVRAAVDEFFADRKEVVIRTVPHQCVVMKGSEDHGGDGEGP